MQAAAANWSHIGPQVMSKQPRSTHKPPVSLSSLISAPMSMWQHSSAKLPRLPRHNPKSSPRLTRSPLYDFCIVQSHQNSKLTHCALMPPPSSSPARTCFRLGHLSRTFVSPIAPVALRSQGPFAALCTGHSARAQATCPTSRTPLSAGVILPFIEPPSVRYALIARAERALTRLSPSRSDPSLSPSLQWAVSHVCALQVASLLFLSRRSDIALSLAQVHRAAASSLAQRLVPRSASAPVQPSTCADSSSRSPRDLPSMTRASPPSGRLQPLDGSPRNPFIRPCSA